MKDTLTFTVCIEDRGKIIREIECKGNDIPLLIVGDDGKYYVKVGRIYTHAGNGYHYVEAEPVSI